CARTNPLVHCLSIATDCKQRFGNVVERLHFLISNGPVGDVVTFLFELIRLPVDLEMRGEAKIDRQGAKGPRTPNDRAASKHRSGPRSTERRSCLLIRCCVDRDRKSTRLNSSHDQISYAVFCLKKKTKLRPKSP